VKPATVLSIAAVSFFLVAAYTVVSTGIFPTLPHDLQPMSGWLAPLMILFIVALALDNSRLSHFMSRPALVNLGEASYAIYILHVPVYWLYERALESGGVANSAWVFGVTFLPMMILLGLAAHFYIDIPLRRWLKKFLQTISIRVFLLDLAIVVLTVFFIFQFRFGEGREYRSYREMERLVFWVAFFVYPALSLAFGAYRPEAMMKPGIQWIRSVFFSSLLSTLVVAGSVYLGYSTGWFENFPRSIFVLEWFVVFSLFVFVRYIFRALKIYPHEALPA
jgi:hypothetical protein